MQAARAVTVTVMLFALPAVCLTQESELAISKDGISVHRVERGTMTLREVASGTITALTPARASVRLSVAQSATVRAGQACTVQVIAPTVLRCTVARVARDPMKGDNVAELALAGALPTRTSIDDRVNALIDVGTADNIVYFDRPATARPATTSTIFVIEADGAHAKRVPVVYGRLSGSQLEILSGLAPGDRVIVTELPEAAGRNRVALK
jgi:HlyD family secretion protein